MPFGIPHLLACLALVAATAVSQAEPPGEPDRLVLRDGTVLVGQIVAETSATVTLALGFGGRVEFRKRDLARFERHGAAAPAAKTEDPEPSRAGRAVERFLIYLGDRPVGFRSVSRSRTTRRGIAGTLYREEAVFSEGVEKTEAGNPGDRTCRVVTLEFIPEGRGGRRTLYYREVGMGTEYIIDAVLCAEHLEYTWLRGGKRTFHRVAAPARLKFPVSSWFDTALPRTERDESNAAVPVFDPRTRTVVAATARRFSVCAVPVGPTKFAVTPVVVGGVRGHRLRWLAANGRTLKEYLNGVSLVAVATNQRGMPKDLDQTPRPDQREAEFVRVCIDPLTGLVLRSPGGGWVRSGMPASGASFMLLNREMQSSIAVYWSATDGEWPGPAAPPDVPVRPMAFGGWPGEGWSANAPDAPGRERVVRRMRTEAGRVTAVLDTPREFSPAALIDFTALLRGTRVPGAGQATTSAR